KGRGGRCCRRGRRRISRQRCKFCSTITSPWWKENPASSASRCSSWRCCRSFRRRPSPFKVPRAHRSRKPRSARRPRPSAAPPSSTFKVAVALAALNEKLITPETQIKLGRRVRMNLTDALAHSNNPYFERLGQRLGFAKVSRYAHQFGLGELAGYDIEGEHLGAFPKTAPGSHDGGIGKMCSYGESISMTPLQLGALMAALANGGTLYYLQHPDTPEEVAGFAPRVKRQLNIAPLIPAVSPGMLAAVRYGTARSLQ